MKTTSRMYCDQFEYMKVRAHRLIELIDKIHKNEVDAGIYDVESISYIANHVDKAIKEIEEHFNVEQD